MFKPFVLLLMLIGLTACTAPAAGDLQVNRIETIRDISYGSHPKQRMDCYLPSGPRYALPVIFMVHGGAWRIGDKAHSGVIDNKVARWVPQGFVVISVNYRLLPEAEPMQQAEDVARAVAAAQAKAPSWGADPSRFILMGHSAGAHLVALLNTDPSIARNRGAKAWLGSVTLDSAALDITRIMNRRHPRFYDRAFGSEPAKWRALSPYYRLAASAPPMLLVCSTRRDDSCPQARRFADRAADLGVSVRLLPQDLTHKQINTELGTPGAYTEAVETFIQSLLH